MKTRLIHEVRASKNKSELASIVKAQKISEAVLNDVLNSLHTGITEIEVSSFIKKSFMNYGAPILSFLPIVAFGKNSSNVYHQPSHYKLEKGDIILLDFGTTVNHYCSDMTRTYFWGAKDGPTSARYKEIYLNVLSAMDLALEMITKRERRAGIIDNVAREYLMEKYEKNFEHALGHGVGTVLHEWPFLKKGSADTIPIGAVITIEPGLYFEDFGGVRIEDMIQITKTGYRNLTKFPKDFESVTLNDDK